MQLTFRLAHNNKFICSPFAKKYNSIMKRSKPTASSSVPKTQKVMDKYLEENKEDVKNKSLFLKKSAKDAEEFMHEIAANRVSAGENVSEFHFLKKRVRILSKNVHEIKDNCAGILYWMLRDARVQDNWSFLFAQKLALKLKLPLMVACTHPQPFLSATLRHHKFYLDGLKEMADECRDLDIPFHLFLGQPEEHIPEFVCEQNIGAVVCDFHALRQPRACIEKVLEKLPKDVSLTEVDAHNLVPMWMASDKQEYGARTIRNKVNSKLKEYLTEFPPLIKHPHADVNQLKNCKEIDWQAALNSQVIDEQVSEVEWSKPGYKAACAQLHSFLTRRLPHYADKRNDPTANMISMMSPWFRYGHISVQRCVLEVNRYRNKYKASVEAFCEEAIVRRELSDNFCYYNKNYDNVKGAANWAQLTLEIHSKDKRGFVYTLKEFEEAHTHDDLWNSAQLQLEKEGKMHGFLRMYWAKKILEWTESPEQALEYAIYFNDKYALDGSDPNGFVGCMWSICGIHDQGWGERPVFGKIRFMNYQGCKRKFDVNAFVVRYGGKSYNTKKSVT